LSDKTARWIKVVLVALAAAQAQQPSKEYVRLGGRVIAIENPQAAGIVVNPCI
jgi:hypothetical protein